MLAHRFEATSTEAHICADMDGFREMASFRHNLCSYHTVRHVARDKSAAGVPNGGEVAVVKAHKPAMVNDRVIHWLLFEKQSKPAGGHH